MDDLVEGLLTFSRLSRQPLKRTIVEPSLIVRRVLEDLMPAARRVEIELGPLPPCHADVTRCSRICCRTPIKYTRDRDPAVVGIGCQDRDGEGVYFVRDNGAGFDMQYATRRFGVFQRLHRADEFEGTGVGLAIVHRIVQAARRTDLGGRRARTRRHVFVHARARASLTVSGRAAHVRPE